MLAWRRWLSAALCGAARLSLTVHRALLACAVGVSDLETIVRGSREGWERTRDFESDAVAHGGFMEFEEAYLKGLPAAGRVLLVGCGGGRELLAFAAKGFRADGLELSARAAELAARRLREVRPDGAVHLGDAAEYEPPAGAYDAVVFSWFVYGGIPGRARRVRALRNAGAALAPRGRILATLGLREGGGAAADDLARWIARLTRNPFRLAPGDAVNSAFRYDHAFTREELEAEAAEASLRVAQWRVGVADNAAAAYAVLESQ
ncbi:MAG: class I SAM-dependent methyltransferase [Elusimicrobia bacterium]|nr:class I SAM-dependent methyltransferase [Elusimicrobiota bacterium]